MERTPDNINQKKESFILYLEQLKILDELTNEEAGILFKTIKNFIYTGSVPELDKLIKIAFIPIQNQLKMDLKKWRETKEKRAIAGSMGGRPSKAKKANALLEKQSKAKKAVNENDNDNVNVNDSVNVNDNAIKEIINYLNDVCSSKYQSTTPKTNQLIKARIKEGFVIDDFKVVIDKKYKEWATDEKFCKFLRPSTLFGSNFESYLNQLEKKAKEFKFDE